MIRKNFVAIFCIAILIFFQDVTFGENVGCICGKVTDAKTKEPLVGVNILVIGTTNGTTTDIEGQYRISNLPVGTYQLEYRYIGYKNIKKTDIVVNPVKSQITNIELIPADIESEEVLVTAGYFEELEKTQVSNIGLSKEEIRRFPGGFEDVVRTVSTLPGVAINTSGGRNDLLVRGGGPSENLYIVNGIEVPNINHFGTQGSSSGSLSFINLDFVENVDFSTGGFSAQYGDKMSSVISLKLAEGRKDRLGSKILLSATQFGINIEGPVTKNQGFIFSARKSYLDLIFKAAGLPFVPVYYDYNLVYNYDISPSKKLFLFGLIAIDEVERDVSTLENRVTNSGIMDNTQNQYISGINYQQLFSGGYFDLSYGVNLNQFRFSQADTALVKYFDSDADEIENKIKFQIYKSIGKTNGISAGFTLQRAGIKNQTTFADTIYNRSGNKISTSNLNIPTLSKVDKNFDKGSFFTEIDYSFLKKFSILAGIRFDYYNYLDNPSYVSPRTTLRYSIDPMTNLKLSYGTYYQSPSYVWLNNPLNSELKALRNDMSIFGIERRVRDDVKFQLELYYKNYQNLPNGTIPGVNDYFVLTNAGTGFGGREDDFQSFGYFELESQSRGKAYGVEMILQKKYSEIPLYGQMSLTYSKSLYETPQYQDIPGIFDQRWIFNLSAGYKLNAKWEISGKFRFFTGVPYTPIYVPAENLVTPGELQNLPEEYLSKRLDSGHHLDIRLDRYFYFKNKEIIFFIDIQNVYNYAIPIRPNYNFWDQSIETQNSIGLLPSIGLSFEF